MRDVCGQSILELLRRPRWRCKVQQSVGRVGFTDTSGCQFPIDATKPDKFQLEPDACPKKNLRCWYPDAFRKCRCRCKLCLYELSWWASLCRRVYFRILSLAEIFGKCVPDPTNHQPLPATK